MADHREHIRKAVAALHVERRRLIREIEQVDVNVAILEELLSRDSSNADSGATREPGEPAKRGDAEREILRMLAGGGVLTAAEIAARRGTTSNAASNVLRRLYKKGVIAHLGGGRYQNKIPPAGGQGSLSVEAEREENTDARGGDS